MYNVWRVGGSVYPSAASVAFVIGSEISPVVVDLHLNQNALCPALHPIDVVLAATEYKMVGFKTRQVIEEYQRPSPCNLTSVVVVFVHTAPSMNSRFEVVKNQIFLWCLIDASIFAPYHASCYWQVFVPCPDMTGKIRNLRKGRRYESIERVTRRYQGS